MINAIKLADATAVKKFCEWGLCWVQHTFNRFNDEFTWKNITIADKMELY